MLYLDDLGCGWMICGVVRMFHVCVDVIFGGVFLLIVLLFFYFLFIWWFNLLVT